MGAHELSIYNYPVKSDTQDMLRSRIDGINSSVQFNDIVIFQLPTWIGLEFERAYLNQLRIYNVKVVLFIQDVVPLMFKQNYDDWMKPYIEFYNQADLIILPNLKMEERLRKEGLTVKKSYISGNLGSSYGLPA
ncbi:hypothetical protein [Limosilactobacillus equigenerosi]|uniref:hypothetical protein n=1 Tax=Limosilactobacillus equigenerosi TaxID=417373 RepID=UPI0006D24F5D|nr:hypothetical protein [Limosilactobacillus equigenerosi]